MSERPVIYLDVDGVLWTVRPGATPGGDPSVWSKGADGLVDFIGWALETCEVRWCTSWAMGGGISEEGLRRLEAHTGVPAETWGRVRPGLGWIEHKGENIPWEEHRRGRPFAWVEDELLPEERQMLAEKGFLDCYVHCDVLEDAQGLRKAHDHLRARFDSAETVRQMSEPDDE